jgi:hypothetical protein
LNERPEGSGEEERLAADREAVPGGYGLGELAVEELVVEDHRRGMAERLPGVVRGG